MYLSSSHVQADLTKGTKSSPYAFLLFVQTQHFFLVEPKIN